MGSKTLFPPPNYSVNRQKASNYISDTIYYLELRCLFAQSCPEDLIGLSWLVTDELLMLELIYSLLIYSQSKSMKKEEQKHY